MEEKKQGFFKKLVGGLTKTRTSILSGLDTLFGGFSEIDEEFYEELLEQLVMADMGVETSDRIIDSLRERVRQERVTEPAACRALLLESIKEQMRVDEQAYAFENKTSVLFIVGVNGVGKTTTVGKLAGRYRSRGKRVVIAAADTFRAAAREQLEQWAHRAGADLVGAGEGADPASVVYDAVASARAKHADILLCDTAGRLHNKKNLMDELGKIYRVIEREYSEAHVETWIVLDATTGQNAICQAREFCQVAPVTGVILTKMDGSAKGGIAVAIESELHIPVKFVGVGEQVEDLQTFDADSFVDALFYEQKEGGAEDADIGEI